jgi:hypothetical protein
MSRSPTGIIPEPLMVPAAKGAVMAFLKQLPVEGDIKVDLLVGWARMVGAFVNGSQRDAVRQSGIDRQ